jgi:hypothetical protein
VAIDDHQHVALPKLYGAPAYARPPVVPVMPVERPFDPDGLPIEAIQTDEERELARQLAGRAREAAAASGPGVSANGSARHQGGRSFRLRAIPGRIRGDKNSAGA